jgi:hypothetical protein
MRRDISHPARLSDTLSNLALPHVQGSRPTFWNPLPPASVLQVSVAGSGV